MPENRLTYRDIAIYTTVMGEVKEGYKKAAQCLGVIAHPARLALIELLLEKPLPVGVLAERCGLAPNTTSEHLRLMQHCGFLESTKQGRHTVYRVTEPHLKDLMRCVQKRFFSKKDQ